MRPRPRFRHRLREVRALCRFELNVSPNTQDDLKVAEKTARFDGSSHRRNCGGRSAGFRSRRAVGVREWPRFKEFAEWRLTPHGSLGFPHCLVVLLTASGQAQTPQPSTLPSPEQFFGFQMGADRKLANWEKLHGTTSCSRRAPTKCGCWSSGRQARGARTSRSSSRRPRIWRSPSVQVRIARTERVDAKKKNWLWCCRNNCYEYFSLKEAEANGLAGISSLPFSLKVLLENLLRHEDGRTVTADDIRGDGAVARRAQERPRDRLPPGAGADAGFHRRAGGGRPRRHARRDGGSSAATRTRSIRWRRSISSSTIR